MPLVVSNANELHRHATGRVRYDEGFQRDGRREGTSRAQQVATMREVTGNSRNDNSRVSNHNKSEYVATRVANQKLNNLSL